MQNTEKKLFVTGGHITPAMAVIDEIRKRHPVWDITLIGRTSAQEGNKDDSPEPVLAAEKSIRFLPITTGRLQRSITPRSFFSLAKFPVGLVQAVRYCFSERPDAVISFGGYVALPVVLAAASLGIPVLTHEQTRVVGLANRIIARFARRICVTFEQAAGAFPGEKTVWTGLPVRAELFLPPKKSFHFGGDKRKPLLYVTGGVAGAVSLNELIFAVLPKLARRFRVIHQTGPISYDRAIAVKRGLKGTAAKNYTVAPYFHAPETSWILHNTALVIARSGANTVVELAGLHIPAILIPLPWSGGGEQEQNALWLAKTGDAEVLHQRTVTPELLFATIARIVKRRKKNTTVRQIDYTHTQAARRVVVEIERMMVQ